jgi:hypothetical protein
MSVHSTGSRDRVAAVVHELELAQRTLDRALQEVLAARPELQLHADALRKLLGASTRLTARFARAIAKRDPRSAARLRRRNDEADRDDDGESSIVIE